MLPPGVRLSAARGRALSGGFIGYLLGALRQPLLVACRPGKQNALDSASVEEPPVSANSDKGNLTSISRFAEICCTDTEDRCERGRW